MKQVICVTFLVLLSYNCDCELLNTTKSRLTSCVYDSDCIENAYCVNRTYCSCKDDYIVHISPKGPACLREATQVGDPCEQALQCTKPFGTHSLCGVDGRCQCNSTAHFKDGRCYESAGLGQKCKVSNNCRIQSEIGVFCDKSVCVCPRKYHFNSDWTDCLKSAYIGDPCSSDETCVSPNSRCREVCRCRVNFVESRDEKRCLQVAERVGDRCEEDSQCGEFLKAAECRNGTCQCSKYYHSTPTTTTCWRSVELGDACTSVNECVTSGNLAMVTCQQGTCQCLTGYSRDPKDPRNCRTKSGSLRKIQHSISKVSLSLIVGVVILYRTLCLNMS